MDYGGYSPYRQLFGAFEHRVSIVDLLFNEGPRARTFMKTPLRMSTAAADRSPPHRLDGT
jgi:hypothetical protein